MLGWLSSVADEIEAMTIEDAPCVVFVISSGCFCCEVLDVRNMTHVLMYESPLTPMEYR